MNIEASPKKWTITAVFADSALSFEKAGRPVGLAGNTDERLSPVEYLLLSAAACMALSLKAAANAADMPLTTVRVAAVGTKPATVPSRLTDVGLRIALHPSPARADAERLVSDAQQMCTVTNTIRDSAQLAVSIDTTITHEGAASGPAQGLKA